MELLVTGAAGFIGFHLCKELLKQGKNVIGYDNLNSYYDINLKISRINELKRISNNQFHDFTFIKGSLESSEQLEEVFQKYNLQVVINLAAQAGVRYSIKNPSAYIQSNIVGFHNVLELSKRYAIKHFIYASSSSVYGGNENLPFRELDKVDHPISIYAATKRSNELIAHTYSHLYDLPVTGLRFFTVYGPWGRPDMALFKFTSSILQGKPIDVFNHGDMMRDFTYIDDVVKSIVKLINKPATSYSKFDRKNPNPSSSWCPFRVFNIGNSKPTSIMSYISEIEDCLKLKAQINFLPMQMGDVKETFADTSLLKEWIYYKPETTIKEGVRNFVNWYIEFYKNK